MSETKKPVVGPQLRRQPTLETDKPVTTQEVKETPKELAASVAAPEPAEPVVTPEPEPEPTPVMAPPPPPPAPEPPKEIKPPVRRGAVTAEAIETKIEQAALLHLHTVQKFPTGTCTIRDIRKGVGEQLDGAQAKQVVDGYVSNGLLSHGWKAAAGRYSLTEAGLAKYNELVEKYGEPD